MNLNNFYFHIKMSPWPILMSLNLMNMMMNLIYNLNYKFNMIIMMIIMMNLNIIIIWMWHLYTLNFLMNYYNYYNKMTKKIFLMLFISSELMFFLSFFYINFSIYYFNNSNYNFNNLKLFNLNFFMALINSLILINSSLTFMMTLYLNMKFKMKSSKFMNITLILSLYFILIQLFEYKMMQFNISNSILFSNFYLLTSFHMFHVIMGSTMMILIKIIKIKTMNTMNLEFKMACIYWHFIDMIWIFIFILFY